MQQPLLTRDAKAASLPAATLRILHVVPAYLPATRYGGPIYSIHSLCKALARLGHDVRVFTTNVDGDRDSDVPIATPVLLDGVQVTYFQSRHLRRLCWSREMQPALRREMPQTSISHIHSVFQWPTSAAAAEARRAGVPYVLSPRGMLVPELIRKHGLLRKAAWLWLRDRSALAGAARLHVTTGAEYRDAGRLPFLPMAPACVIPNGVDFPDDLESGAPSAEIQRASQNAPYALFLGRISWTKGLDRALAALAGTSIRLLIAGNDDEGLTPALQRQAAQLGVISTVEFLGRVDGADKWGLLRNAKFLLLPSYNESFGNVVPEALSVGCPCVVTEEVGAGEILKASESGIVCAGHVAALRSAMLSLWNDSLDRHRMGEAGKRYVREHLAWSSIAASMVQCYRQVLSE